MKLLTYADLAALSGVPVATLRAWRSRGKLKPPDVTTNRVVFWFDTPELREEIGGWNGHRRSG